MKLSNSVHACIEFIFLSQVNHTLHSWALNIIKSTEEPPNFTIVFYLVFLLFGSCHVASYQMIQT